jgi:hypothetical protein
MSTITGQLEGGKTNLDTLRGPRPPQRTATVRSWCRFSLIQFVASAPRRGLLGPCGCVGVIGAKARIAADTTAAACGPQPRLGALSDQRPLELGDGAQYQQREHALWRGGVDRVAQAAELRALGLELFDDSEQVADRAAEAIEPDDDQGLARADLAQQARQNRPGTIRAGGMRGVAAGGAQLVELRIGAPFFGRDPCLADQTAHGCGSPAVCAHSALTPRPGDPLMQLDTTHTNGRLRGWPKAWAGRTGCQHSGRAGALGRHAPPQGRLEMRTVIARCIEDMLTTP